MIDRSAQSPHRRVRRGSAEDHDSLRRQIVAAAFDIHARDGVDALSMRSLGAAVGVSPMALYRYYPSKAELLRSMWEVVLGEAQATVRAAVARHATARARLRASIDGFFAYWEAHPSHFMLVYMTPETMQEAGASSPLTRSPAYTAAVDLSSPLIDELVESGITGLIVHNEAALPGVISALARRGPGAAHSIQVVAIGPKSLLLAPLLPMTVIDIPGTTIGSTAVDMLMALVNDKSLPERRLVAPRVE